MDEVSLAGIEAPSFVAVTRADEVDGDPCAAYRAAFPSLDILGVSVLDEGALDALREAVWALTGLIRVRLRLAGDVDEEPLAIAPGSTVADVADRVHHELGAEAVGARVWGPSARFDGQRVGREHEVLDGDIVEILR